VADSVFTAGLLVSIQRFNIAVHVDLSEEVWWVSQ